MTEAPKSGTVGCCFRALFISRKHGVVCHLFRGNWAPIESPGGRKQGPWIGQRKGEVMKPSSPRVRRVLWLGGAAAAAAALAAAGVTSSVAAQPASLAGTNTRGPGYPPPKGIYKPFTNCPLKNPIMHETGQLSATNTFGGFAACTAGNATGGSITIGTITTPVTEPVNVQFGFAWTPSNAGFPLPVYPPLAGDSALLSTKPDLIPESLTTA